MAYLFATKDGRVKKLKNEFYTCEYASKNESSLITWK